MGALCFKEAPIDFDDEVELNHFQLLRSVGKGAFSKVRIVQHKRTNQLFALKYINKEKCIRMKAVENIMQESKMLEEINHPFIWCAIRLTFPPPSIEQILIFHNSNLRFAFQDDENLFIVLDLMLGGDLRFHLDRLNVFPEAQVRFYVAEVASALDYLHSHSIVHRDLVCILICDEQRSYRSSERPNNCS